MKVEILEFVEGAQNAKGVAVIIDVFRAFSVACYAVDSGAVRIIATSEVSEAFLLKKKYKNSILVGERDEKYIKSIDPDHVSLVAMGYRATNSAEEDLMCAEMIASELKNERFIPENRIADLRNTSGKRFFNPDNIDFSPPTDFFLCTMINKFDFVLKRSEEHTS